jgi:hypothetical protein
VEVSAPAAAWFTEAAIGIEGEFRQAVAAEIETARRAGVHVSTLHDPFPPTTADIAPGRKVNSDAG